MQGREMTKLFTSNKEERIKQIDKLGEEIPPGKIESTHGGRAVGVVHRLALPAVVSADIEPPPLQEHPRAEHCLEQVVRKHDAFDLVRLPPCHEPETCWI